MIVYVFFNDFLFLRSKMLPAKEIVSITQKKKNTYIIFGHGINENERDKSKERKREKRE